MLNYNYNENRDIISQEYCPEGMIAIIGGEDGGVDGGVGRSNEKREIIGYKGKRRIIGGNGKKKNEGNGVGDGSGNGGKEVGSNGVSGDGGNGGSKKDSLALVIITILHIIVILFVLITPFTNYNYFLFMHAIIVPFIMLHWYLNNNTCSLTIAEKEIRKRMNGGSKNVDDDECYTYKFIAPIYDFNKNHEEYSNFIYILTSGLWVLTLYKLYRKINDGSITSFADLMT